ncbi:response regulator [Myxococcus xanthus DK 1622]|uniref:Response regulator n=5 Tax=Myxococcaceae TaxID=31 RepID=Q1DF41_MYXXD|nr:RedF [Myxococcus xanthus DZ2]ABF91004.1 response regulator [Myxococcus xanthus DK 1622]NOJ58034.1 response regulator [Myxococcus xanthus]NOJ83162.1 response regulator [Myxococcus xanthus]NOJ90507.1 response regulator [Myxococcus xanthus]
MMETNWTFGRCLLLVEDDPSNRMTLSALLEDAGFAVVTAGSYSEAAGLLNRPRAYDAVLLDQSLGDGFGTGLIPLVRHHMPKTKVVFVTGHDGKIDMPVDAVFRKGGHFDDLLAFLFKLLPQRPLGA